MCHSMVSGKNIYVNINIHNLLDFHATVKKEKFVFFIPFSYLLICNK